MSLDGLEEDDPGGRLLPTGPPEPALLAARLRLAANSAGGPALNLLVHHALGR